MGFLIGLAARLVGPKLAPFLAYGFIIAVLLGILWWLRNDAYHDGVRHMQAEIDRANRQFLQQKARADELAANQRLTDTIAVNRQEQELRDAIAETPDSAPDHVRIRLGCERLRRAGTDTTRIPACR